MQGRRVKVDFVDKIGCFRISIETVVIPARSEIIAYCSNKYQDQQILGLIEPAEKNCEIRQGFSSKFSGLLEGRTDICQNDEPFGG